MTEVSTSQTERPALISREEQWSARRRRYLRYVLKHTAVLRAGRKAEYRKKFLHNIDKARNIKDVNEVAHVEYVTPAQAPSKKELEKKIKRIITDEKKGKGDGTKGAEALSTLVGRDEDQVEVLREVLGKEIVRGKQSKKQKELIAKVMQTVEADRKTINKLQQRVRQLDAALQEDKQQKIVKEKKGGNKKRETKKIPDAKDKQLQQLRSSLNDIQNQIVDKTRELEKLRASDPSQVASLQTDLSKLQELEQRLERVWYKLAL